MEANRNDTIAKLRKELFYLQGLKYTAGSACIPPGFEPLLDSFPGRSFPTGVIHEFLNEDPGATSGFLAGILSTLLKRNGVCIWLGPDPIVFPPSLCNFNIAPDSIIFIALQKEKELLRAIEESLKCNALAAVVGEIQGLSFTASRRLQLAVEQSRVTGFLLRKQFSSASVAVARWKIISLPSEPEENLPGVGHPKWKIDLLKIRNGKPGSWELTWIDGQFQQSEQITYPDWIPQQKTG